MARGKSRRSTRAPQSQDSDFQCDTPSVVRQYREKHAPQSVSRQDKKARREYMTKNPETLVVVEEFEDISLDNSGVLAAGSHLSMFYTKRPDVWIQTCRNFYKHANLHVHEVSDSNGVQLRMKRNKNDGDLLYALSLGKTGFVNVQGKDHEVWGETDFYAIHSMMEQQHDSLSFSEDTQFTNMSSQPELMQSQSLFSTPDPTLSPISPSSNDSVVITQNSEQFTQASEGAIQHSQPNNTQVLHDAETVFATSSTQPTNLHPSDDTQPLSYPQSLCTPPFESISGSPSDSGLVQATDDPDAGSKDAITSQLPQDDSDVTISSKLSQDDNGAAPSQLDDKSVTRQPASHDDSPMQKTQVSVSESSELSEVLIPLILPNPVTIENLSESPDDIHSSANLEETIVDNRKPVNSCIKNSSTPKRGHDVTLNATSAGSPIPTQSNMDTSKHSPRQHDIQSNTKKSSQQKTRLPDTSPLFFKFKGDHSWLSNMYQDDELTQFELCDYSKWKSREHCYQWRKAIFHEEWVLANAILSAPTAEEAKALGGQIICKPEWQDKKKSVMKEIISGYCEQKNWFVEKLKSTGSRPLCENTTDSDWGALNGGSNWLGEILMDQRKDYLLHDSAHPKPSPATNQTKANQNDAPQPLNKQKEHDKSLSSRKQKKVLLFGDSIPNGVPLDVPGMICNVNSHSGARVTVPKTAGNDYVPSSTLLKQDMNGDEDYVGLLIGINDVAHTNVTRFKAPYRMLVKTAKSKGAKVICHQIFHRGDRRDLNVKIDTFNHAIFQVAMEEECACVNSTSSYNSTAWRPNVNMLVGGRLHLKPWAKRTLANRLSTVIRQIDTVVSAPSPSAPRHTPPKPSTRGRSPNHLRSRRTHDQDHRDPYARWDSCYRPTPNHHRPNPNTRWQQYPISTDYHGEW